MNEPLEGSEIGGSLYRSTCLARTPAKLGEKVGLGDESGKPEDHGEGFHRKDDERMGCLCEKARCKDKERYNEEGGPDGSEDQKVDLAG